MEERGSATAELAVAFPSLLVVLGVALWMIGVATTQLRCADAARAGARAAARGESDAAVRARAAAATGLRGAAVRIQRVGGDVVVDVRAPARAPGGVLRRVVPVVHLHAIARAAAEDLADVP
ncbi:MAG: TadE family type IV pilus minor pilin [Mycobacteriales bacterium]|nr:pilus assembly protein [Frankia sp.]